MIWTSDLSLLLNGESKVDGGFYCVYEVVSGMERWKYTRMMHNEME